MEAGQDGGMKPEDFMKPKDETKFQHTSHADIKGMRENGYQGMPPVEETLASYLSVGETSSLKAPSLPSKPLQKYAAAGQAVASLHTMAVLQAYQADLLKDLDKRSRSEPEQRKGPGPSPSGQRWAQKASVAAHAPPPPASRARGRHGLKRGRQDL